MDDVVELSLSRAVNVTNTAYIRASLQDRIEADNLVGPPIELVQFHVFIHCTHGSGKHMVDFEEYGVQPGTAIWVRPGQVQRWSNIDADFDADVVVFESSMIPDLPLFNHVTGTTRIDLKPDDASRLRQQMEWMAADLAMNRDTSVAASVVGVILRLFTRNIDTSGEPADTAGSRLAAVFVESVDRHIQQRSVAWHARQVGASTRSVARATEEAFRKRPKEIVDERVILGARRRLAWSSDDIATIARTLSFLKPPTSRNFSKRGPALRRQHFEMRTG